MRCRKAEHLLPLYGEAELTDRENRALQRHLEVCAACVELSAALHDLERSVTEVRELEPVLSDPAGMTAGIMAKVSDEARQRTGEWRRNPAIGGRHRWSRLQPALAGALALVVIVLGVQETLLLRRLARLETRMKELGAAVVAEPVSPAQAGGMLDSELTKLAYRGGLVAGVYSPRGGEDLIVLRRSELGRLLAEFAGPGADPATIEELLARRFPELGTIKLADGLTAGEARRLLAYRTEILDALRGI